jgi:hypothetical protein
VTDWKGGAPSAVGVLFACKIFLKKVEKSGNKIAMDSVIHM